MTKIRTFFPKIRALSSSFQESAGYSISMIFLRKCSALDPVDTGRTLKVLRTFNLRPLTTGKLYLLPVLQSSLYIVHIIKKMCKTASFSTKFRAIKLKADTCSVFLIFISMNHQQLLSFSALCIGLCSKKKCKAPNQTKFGKLEKKFDGFSVSVSFK